MPTWNSRGLRGSTLEDLINATNDLYREKKLGLVQKIPTSIIPVKFDKDNRLITKAYFEKESTVDYIGVIQGIPICFDAKECSKDTFSLNNIHQHQYNFMKEFEAQNGISFIIIMFSTRNDFYYLSFKELDKFIKRTVDGHYKNFKYLELRDEFFIKSEAGALVHYIKQLQLDIKERENNV